MPDTKFWRMFWSAKPMATAATAPAAKTVVRLMPIVWRATPKPTMSTE